MAIPLYKLQRGSSSSQHLKTVEQICCRYSIKMNKLTLLVLIPCVVFVLTQAYGYYPAAGGVGGAGPYPYTGYYQQYALESQKGAKQSNFVNLLLFFTFFALATNLTGNISG